MNPRLGFLESEIPILEAKLKAMKRERRTLKAAATMRAKRQNPDFNAKMKAAIRQNWNNPETQQRFAAVRHNADNKLPWPNGTPERNRYRSLTRKGWPRELAVEKIEAKP